MPLSAPLTFTFPCFIIKALVPGIEKSSPPVDRFILISGWFNTKLPFFSNNAFSPDSPPVGPLSEKLLLIVKEGV